jgi:hypothetical protein
MLGERGSDRKYTAYNNKGLLRAKKASEVFPSPFLFWLQKKKEKKNGIE